ncbi:MAG: hydrolase family protein [Frankiales bacterium]|nr:hydrolase family protein [Frankiales bacterium]
MRTWTTRHPLLAAGLAVALVLGSVWGVKLTRVVLSVERNAEYWSVPRGQEGGLLYVALGDSAAQGIGASGPGKGYVGLLAERLRQRTGRPVEVINISESGARIRDVLATQLPALTALGRTPDVLTVGIGGNDVRAYDRETFTAEVERLTGALPAGAYVADAPYFMHGRWERDAQQAADLLTASASAHAQRPVRLHEALRAQGWQAMLTQYAADWFHPNDRGHRVWADAFWAAMEADPVLGPER